jgi:hypothetical protein
MCYPAGFLLMSAIGVKCVREKNSRATANQKRNNERHERYSFGETANDRRRFVSGSLRGPRKWLRSADAPSGRSCFSMLALLWFGTCSANLAVQRCSHLL